MGYLTNKKIDNINQKGIYTDGDGLRLRVDKKINKNWIFRYQLFGKSKDMGGRVPGGMYQNAKSLGAADEKCNF